MIEEKRRGREEDEGFVEGVDATTV